MSLEKSPEKDKLYCSSIAKSICDIIRFSLDEDFRKKSFELFGVSSTKETEREIKKRLMFLIQNEKTGIQRDLISTQGKSGHSLKVKEKESTHARGDSQNIEEAVLTQSTTTDSNSQGTPQNIFKRNWLQISSQQYREILKRKKLNYYSQPQFGQRNQNESEFLTSRTYFSDSQGSSSCSSLLSEERMSSSEPLTDTKNYLKEKFRDSFRDNVQKYFKNNVKSDRIPSETPQTNRNFNFF